MDDLYPSTPTILQCPTCHRTAIHDKRGCRMCRCEALDRLIDKTVGQPGADDS